jgi:hypothetical protein
VGVGSLSGMKPLRVGIREVEPFGREGEPVCCLDGRCYAVGMAYRDCPARRPKARTPKNPTPAAVTRRAWKPFPMLWNPSPVGILANGLVGMGYSNE